jgi:hypothetical protein
VGKVKSVINDWKLMLKTATGTGGLESSRANETRKRRTRRRIAGTIVCIAIISIGIGSLQIGYNPWRSRMLRGEPVVAQFYCAVQTVLDCNISFRLTYEKHGSTWCENIQHSDKAEVYPTHWCNGDPGQNKFSVFGAIFTFDRFGAVTVGEHLVGQLRLP